jgi:radical SAM protein with 4Fe4S-binding SPASM domain
VILTLSAPVLYSLELTPACNSRCYGCFNVFAAERARSPLPFEAWRRIIERIQPHAHLIKLTGGEPTLHSDFQGIVTYLSELDISFSLFTNACWPAPENLVAFLKRVPQLRGLLVSLHGAAPAAHEAFSGVRGSFERAVKNIRQAAEAGLRVTISTVIHRQNLEQLADIVALVCDFGADHAVFNRYLGPKGPAVEPTDDQLRQAVLVIEALRQDGARVKFGNSIPRCFVESSSTGCLSGVAYCAIDPWGNVRPCNHSSLVCGNLLEQSVEEAWQSPEMQRWRAMVPADCHACVEFPECHGGCRAVAMEQGLEKDPLANVPLVAKGSPARRISLYEGLRPVGVYQLREEEFGLVLMRGNRIVPVPHEARPILDLCNGRTTLKQVGRRFGQPGLDLVGTLWQKEMLLLQD